MPLTRLEALLDLGRQDGPCGVAVGRGEVGEESRRLFRPAEGDRFDAAPPRADAALAASARRRQRPVGIPINTANAWAGYAQDSWADCLAACKATE